MSGVCDKPCTTPKPFAPTVDCRMEFAGKVVLITGASSGIGAATAEEFASRGATLVLTGQTLEHLKRVSEKCASRQATPKLLILNGNITDENFVKKLVKETVENFGRLDVLVNNAGILEAGSIENTTIEQYDRVFNVNVRAVYRLTIEAVPYLIKVKGSIVNVSSVNGTRSFPGVLAYCMSKSAVDQFTRCTALDLASKGVRVNSVNPGVIITELHRRMGMKDDEYQKFLIRSKETHALGRPGEPGEVAKSIVFLASQDSSFTTGEHLHVDGGRHAMCPR